MKYAKTGTPVGHRFLRSLTSALLALILLLSCLSGCKKQAPAQTESLPAQTESLPAVTESSAQTEAPPTETEAATEVPTEFVTEPVTEEITEAPPTVTEAAIEVPTEAATEPVTEAPTEPPETEPVVYRPAETLNSEEAVLDWLALCKEEGAEKIEIKCSQTLFDSLCENSFVGIWNLLLKSGFDGTLRYNNSESTFILADAVFSNVSWAECSSEEEVRKAILEAAEPGLELMYLFCPPELGEALYREEEKLLNYGAQAGCTSIKVSRSRDYSRISLKNFEAISGAWVAVSNADAFRAAVASFAGEGLEKFKIVFDYDYFLQMKKDSDLFPLAAASSKLRSYRYNKSYYGIFSFTEVNYTEEPKLICNTEAEFVKGIRQMGQEGVDSFWLCFPSDLFDQLTEAYSYANMHKLEAEGGMSTSEYYNVKDHYVRYSGAKIETDPYLASSSKAAIDYVDRCVESGKEQITVFCTEDLYEYLIRGLDSSINIFGPSGMEPIYDLISHAGIYDCDLSAYRSTYAITIGVKQLYPGTEILLAVKAGATDELNPRLQETLAAARELAEQCKGSSKLKTAESIHDALCERITYTIDDDTVEDDTAIGALLNGQADCDGYSDAFYLTGSLAGLEVRCQHGDSNNQNFSVFNSSTHMWNLLKLDGSWRVVDVTWDDGFGSVVHTWFNIGTDRASRTHKWNADMTVSVKEKTDMGTRPDSEHSVKSKSELQQALKSSIDREAPVIVLFFESASYTSYSDAYSIIREYTDKRFSTSWSPEMKALTIQFH